MGRAWLLDLDFGGFVVRTASRSVIVDGVAYPEGLGDLEVITSAEDGPSGRSIALTIAPPTTMTWAELRASGVRLSTGEATLRLWADGQTLDQTRTVASGYLHGVEWGRGQAPLVASLEAPPWGDGTRMVDEAHVVNLETWPVQDVATFSTDPAVVGASPAVIVGFAGDVDYLRTAHVAPSDTAAEGPPSYPLVRKKKWAQLTEGAPGLLVEWSKYTVPGTLSVLAFASHQVTAAQAIVWDQSDGRFDIFPVQHKANGQGKITAFVDWSHGSWVRPLIGHEYWVILIDEDGYGGGLASDKGGTMTGLGEFLVWALSRMQVAMSIADQKASRATLDRYNIQAVINGDTTIWDWVRAEVTPIFPIRYVETGQGGYLAHWPWDATDADVVDELHITRDGLSVVANPKADDSTIANHLVLHYAVTASGPTKTAVLTNANDVGRSERYDALCARSQAMPHGRQAKTWTSATITDDATAWQALRAKARELAMPREDIFIEHAGARLDHLKPLEVVRLVAPEYGWPSVRAVVEQIAESSTTRQVALRILEEP